MGQLVRQYLSESERFVGRGDMNIAFANQATSARGMGPIPIKIRNVLVIIILIQKQENTVLAVPGGPSRILQPRADLIQGALRKIEKLPAQVGVQRREQDEVRGILHLIITSQVRLKLHDPLLGGFGPCGIQVKWSADSLLDGLGNALPIGP